MFKTLEIRKRIYKKIERNVINKTCILYIYRKLMKQKIKTQKRWSLTLNVNLKKNTPLKQTSEKMNRRKKCKKLQYQELKRGTNYRYSRNF